MSTKVDLTNLERIAENERLRQAFENEIGRHMMGCETAGWTGHKSEKGLLLFRLRTAINEEE